MEQTTLSRSDLLGDLIDEILVHDINYEKKTDSLIKKNGITTFCNYGSAKQLKKLQLIISRCFHIDDKEYEHCFPNGKFGLSKEIIIQKALLYFKKHGVDFTTQIKSVCQDEQEFDNIILHAINDFLIPTAFLPVENKNDKNAEPTFGKFDDIHDYFEEALRNLKIMLVKFRSMRMFQSSDPSYEIIDCEYKHKEQCNYKVLLNITDLKLNLHYVPKWEPDYVEIPQNVYRKMKDCNDFLDRLEQKTPFDKLMEGFISLLPDNTDQSFQLEDIVFESDTDPIRYPLSPVNMYYSRFYPVVFEYITYFDEKTVEKEYPGISTHEELKSAVAIKASKDIKAYLLKKIKAKYIEIAHYIESVLDALMHADLNELINMHPNNKEICDKTFDAFHLPAEEIYTIISGYEIEQSAVLLRAYHSLQSGLFSFLRTLQESGLHFAFKFQEYLDVEHLAAHKDIVYRFLTSDSLANAVSIQQNEPNEITDQKKQEKTYEQIARDYMKINDINHRYNGLFIGFKTVLSEYYTQLNNPDPERDPFKGCDCTDPYIQDPDHPRNNSGFIG